MAALNEANAASISHRVRRTVQCRDCGNTVRLWQEGPKTVIGQDGLVKFCSICGSNRVIVSLDDDLDYWEVLGEEYGYPADIIKIVFESWNPNEHHHFGDYVKELQEEVA